MASMREIKRRRGSIQSTQQITKAMKLVSTVKLQKARMRAENSKAYFEYMYQTVTSMLAKAGNIEHPYLQKSDSKNVAVVAVTSNRGLAGGYNANIARLIVESGIEKELIRLYTVGRKGVESLARKGYQIAEDYWISLTNRRMQMHAGSGRDCLMISQKEKSEKSMWRIQSLKIRSVIFRS